MEPRSAFIGKAGPTKSPEEKAFSLVSFPICEHCMLSNSAYNQLHTFDLFFNYFLPKNKPKAAYLVCATQNTKQVHSNKAWLTRMKINSPRAAAEESCITINWYFTYTHTGAVGFHSVKSG